MLSICNKQLITIELICIVFLRYGMVFIPFVGIDNHWKTVTFAAVLLEKEDKENYVWACEAFKKVFGINVKCIITDQDAAMKIAIEQCFPLVKHRLCMWHIMKKFPAKVIFYLRRWRSFFIRYL